MNVDEVIARYDRELRAYIADVNQAAPAHIARERALPSSVFAPVDSPMLSAECHPEDGPEYG
jgi:hypothetical protein